MCKDGEKLEPYKLYNGNITICGPATGETIFDLPSGRVILKPGDHLKLSNLRNFSFKPKP